MNFRTQEAFGKDLNVSRLKISRVATNFENPTISMIEQIVQKKNISADWLFTGKGPIFRSEKPQSTQKTSLTDLTHSIQELTQAIKTIKK